MKNLLRIVTLLLALVLRANSQGTTAFFFTSSPQSWVGQGETALVTQADGFAFSVSLGGAVFARVEGTAPDARNWGLDLAAPHFALLEPGVYLGATRYPFEEQDTPGLVFAGNGRGADTSTGSFNVLEVTYGPLNTVQSLAVDFIQYDDGILDQWSQGSFRYNSPIPIPEPATLALAILASLHLLAARARQRLHNG